MNCVLPASSIYFAVKKLSISVSGLEPRDSTLLFQLDFEQDSQPKGSRF
jgi:hypothetical protein